MAEVQRITARFDANVSRLESGLRRARSSVDRQGRAMENRVKQLDNRFERVGATFGKKLMTGLAAAATVEGLRRIANASEQAIDKLDRIGKTADKLGVTTDALQELRGAAELSGVAVNTFDMGLQRFTRRAAEAAQGTGEAKDALNELGIELRNADGNLRPAEELLRDIADAFSNIENPATRVRLAFKLFDSEGVAMVNMLQKGGAELDNMRRKFREAGAVIEEDAIRKSERLRDELTLLQRALDADVTQALVRLGPVIRDIGALFVWLSNLIANAHEGWRRLFSGEMFQSGSDAITGRLGQARAELKAINQEIDNLTSGKPTGVGTELSRGPGGVAAATEGRVDPMKDPDAAFQKLERLQAQAIEAEAEVRKLETALTELGGGAEDVDSGPAPIDPDSPGGGPGIPGVPSASSVAETASAYDALAQSIQGTIQSERDLIEQSELMKENLDAEDSVRQLLLEKLRIEQEERMLLAEIQANSADLTDQEVESLKKLVEELTRVKNLRAEADANLQNMETGLQGAEEKQQQWAAAIKSTGDELVRLIDQGGSALEILASLAKMILSLPGVESAIGDTLSGALGSISFSAKGNVFQSGRIQRFASGGIVQRPTTFPTRSGIGLMGEAGPEAIMPLSRGRDGKLGVQMEGGGVTFGQVVFHINAPDERTGREAGSAAARRMAEMAGRGRSYM